MVSWKPVSWLRGGFEARWKQREISQSGQWWQECRLTFFAGGAGLRYAYSGCEHSADVWPAVPLPLKEEAEAMVRRAGLAGCEFKAVSGNLYAENYHGIGLHSDGGFVAPG